MSSIPRIGIDAMGGDFGSRAVAEGTALALREMPGRFKVTLVGDEREIRAAIQAVKADDLGIEVVHAPERIEMAEKAAAAVRKKSQSSLVVMTQLHRDGKLDAIFSAGNTGAVVATALLGLGRLPGVTRPALTNAGAVHDPLVRGVDHRFEVVIRQHALRQVLAGARDRDAPNLVRLQ